MPKEAPKKHPGKPQDPVEAWLKAHPGVHAPPGGWQRVSIRLHVNGVCSPGTCVATMDHGGPAWSA